MKRSNPYLVIDRDRVRDCCGTEIWHGPWQWFLIAPKRSPMIEVIGAVEQMTVQDALKKAWSMLQPAPSRQWISRRGNRILESDGQPLMMTILVGHNWNVYDLRTGEAKIIGFGLPNWELAKMLAEDTLTV